MSWRFVFPVHKSCLILVEPKPFSISKELEDEVNAIWKDESKKRKALFNGEIFSLTRASPGVIYGRFIEYKYYVARNKQPHLAKELKLQPALAVSGITCCPGHILVGKRSNWVFSYKGYYECVPSGSIDKSSEKNGKINCIQQLKLEFEEESGIQSKYIKHIHPLGLFYSPTSFTYDLGFVLEVKKTAVKPSSEYQELFWQPMQEMDAFIEKRRFVALSKALYAKFLDTKISENF